MTEELTEQFNNIYTNDGGFYGVLEEIEDKLHIGRVTRKGNGLYQITTGGCSDDEEILYSLMSFLSRFGRNHYVGKLRGGVFYFAEHLECLTGAFEIIEKLPDKETCNPKICCWCKYSHNGKRDPGDPARGITLCDGCRYNEKFGHIEIKVRW